MRFQVIKVSAEEVSLVRLDKQNDGSTVKTELTNPARPLPSFAAALQAFAPYACELIGAPKWTATAKVSSVHLSDDTRTNRRGLIVTFTKRIERAKNRVVVVNTPLMHAGDSETQVGAGAGFFDNDISELIGKLEQHAKLYWNGEREQGEIFAQDPNAKPAPETSEAGGDELASRRSRRPPTGGAAPGEIQNPDATVPPPSDTKLRTLLLRAGRDVSLAAISTWTASEVRDAGSWARAKVGKMKLPPEPRCLKTDATPAIF